MIKGHKVRLLPTEEQEKLLWKSVNASRFVWNWGLAFQMDRFSNGESHLSGYDLRKVLVPLKKTEKFNWLNEVSSKVCSQGLLDLDTAYKKFFKIQKTGEKFTKKAIQKAKRKGRKLTPYDLNGHPKFKSKRKAKPSFYVTVDNFYFKDGNAILEKIGKMPYQTTYELPQGRNTCKFTNPRVSYENGKWILSFGMDSKNQAETLKDYSVGIDLGVKDLAVISCNGEKTVFKNINKTKRVRKLKKRLKQSQHNVSRKYHANGKYDKTSNILKAEQKQKQLYIKLKNIRKDYAHKVTTKIVRLLPKTIVMEDLNVQGMMKNEHLAEAIQEQLFYEFLRQIEYKCRAKGITLIQANRFYPSSKKCSQCGSIKHNLKLKDRKYICEHCNLAIDRDFNAAINLEKLAY